MKVEGSQDQKTPESSPPIVNSVAMRVLIADDSSVMRRIVKNSLVNIGYDCAEILESSDGQDALKLIQGQPLDIVFLEWNIPNINGLELVKQIRKEPQFTNLPLVMITSVFERHNIMKAAKAGVDEYLIKPFSEEKLSEIMMRLESKNLLSGICED